MSNSDTNWDCIKCGFTNNPRRTHCYKCWAQHSDTGDKPGKHGDVYSAGEDLENQAFGCTCGFTTVSAEVMSNHLDEPLPPPTQSESELGVTIDFLFKEWRRGAITDVLLQWNIKQRVAQRERAARIDELNKMWVDAEVTVLGARYITERLAELTKGDK